MTFLRSHSLFDHCGAFESDNTVLTTEFENPSTEICSVETNATLNLMTDSAINDACTDATSELASGILDDYIAEEFITDILGSCEMHQDGHDTHSPTCSGFIISDDDHFVTFDSDHGATDWGCDMSMNTEF